jgi:hypothetical protein
LTDAEQSSQILHLGQSSEILADTTNVVTHVVESEPVLTVTKEAVPPSGSLVVPGEIITYTVTLENQGDANAEGLVSAIRCRSTGQWCTRQQQGM